MAQQRVTSTTYPYLPVRVTIRGQKRDGLLALLDFRVTFDHGQQVIAEP